MVALTRLILTHVLTGSIVALLKDHMLAIHTDEDRVIHFNYPLLWSCLCMLGQAICLPASPMKKIDAPFKHFALLGLLETLYVGASNLAFYALLGSHIFIIVRGGEMFCTIVLSQLVFARKVQPHHCLGLFFNCAAVTFMGGCAFSIRSPQHGYLTEEEHDRHVWSGLSLCACAMIVGACCDVYSEVMVKHYKIDPVQLVGISGVVGVPITIAALCIVNPLGYESTPESLHLLQGSDWLKFCVGALVIIQSGQSASGVILGKYGTAVLRSCSAMSRMTVVWGFEVYFGWAQFSLFQFCSMIMVGLGTLIYSRILILPCMPEREDDSRDVAERQALQIEAVEDGTVEECTGKDGNQHAEE
eukprot:TRINITY_DN18402_c0_g2_i1.p1 TRINITY_DN18402_c0_g2~~TRINITY_DN18402_c0_g2_i1.p1  ORF type:complete len:359 (+),score=50.07 TRINITY_DN18402_c0_g2_i1:49-1125(+)